MCRSTSPPWEKGITSSPRLVRRRSREPARRRLRRVEGFTATEVPDDEKPPLLRVFLVHRARETQGLFAAGPEATDAGFHDLSPEHPVFARRNSG